SEYATQKKDLGVVLRPFERFERTWTPHYKYHGQTERAEMPMFVGGGKLVFEPDLRRADVHEYLRREYLYARNLKRTPRSSPVLRVDRLQVPIYDRGGAFIVDVRSPYVIVGGNLRMKMHKRGTSKRDGLSVSVRNYDPSRGSPTLYQMMDRASGDFELELDLTQGIQPWGQIGNTFYELIVGMSASGETDPPGVTGIDAFRLETEVQCAPKALPALTLGENTIRYSDESTGARDVRVTHLWKERRDGVPPQAPVRLAPDGDRVDTLGPTLEWKQPEGTRDVVDYQIMVSRWAHCRLPHCANLYGTLGGRQTFFPVPLGWLNPQTTYTWKVRAKDAAGDWGPWSKVARFRTTK
ncbi:MAG TPA: fibronectin type III domain-containing protein, partial [Planctomycetota bacterium]|nr:fibronectin type III domain-containing protein [Planctomycetota bacterium]